MFTKFIKQMKRQLLHPFCRPISCTESPVDGGILEEACLSRGAIKRTRNPINGTKVKVRQANLRHCRMGAVEMFGMPIEIFLKGKVYQPDNCALVHSDKSQAGG